MSASYIHRDPLVLSPTTLQLISTKTGVIGCQNDFMASSGRSYLDRPVSSATKHSPPTHSQVSLQSPKMSPDSTLSHHLPAHSTTPTSRFVPNNSPSLCAPSCASSGDGFLRSALTSNSIATSDNTIGEKHCVGSSTGNGQSTGPMSIKIDVDASSTRDPTPLSPTMLMRPRALTSSNLSRSMTPNNSNNTPVSSATSASTPSSTTPVKKSSRRNPWGSETYSDLISIAIHSYPDQQATLQQIYDFIVTHYEYFRERSDPTSSAGWKNSIRHNLSLHDRFTKCPKSSDNTKSSYWRINTEVASKPYVRRRACSMDTTNLKRPAGGGHCGKANRTSGAGHRTGTHQTQVSSSEKLMDGTNTVSRSNAMPSLSEVQCSTLTPLLTSVDSMNSRLDSRQTVTRNPTGSAFSRASYLGTGKIPNYLNYATSNSGLGKQGQDLLSSSYNGMTGRWSNPKPSQTPFRPGYPNSSGPYLYDQGASNFSFESADFSSILGSTDQAMVRCRASGLIEQLLCSDHPMGAVLGSGKPTPPVVTLPQNVYLPNAFSANRLAQHMTTTNGPNRILTDSSSNFLHDPTLSHSPAVDLRPQTSLHGNSLISESVTDARSAHHQHHHLRPVQNCGSGPDVASSSAFTATSWNPYMPQFHLASSSVGYSGFNGTGPFVSQSDMNHLSEAKVKYDLCETMTSGNGPAQRLLPFLSGPHATSLSPSTCSSTGSSTTSWRHSLGLDIQTHVEQHRLTSVQPATAASPCSGQSNTGHENRSLGPPVTPPNPLYYSPMRHSLSDAYGNTECALDTPPYQQHSIKPESLDVLEVPSNLVMSTAAVASSVGATDYDNSSRAASATSQSNYATSSNAGMVGLRQHSTIDSNSEMNTRFADAYSYDDDCEPLELELSLELADRIVGSTRSSDSKP